jgi:hypothetical protein
MKTGGNTTFVNDNTFFTVSNKYLWPKILYDKYTQRYYFIDLDGTKWSSLKYSFSSFHKPMILRSLESNTI